NNCDRAYEILQQHARLDLSAKSIADLRPLASLTHLTHLILYDNQIRDISPLENLINLQELQIWDNCIEDLTPIFNLPNLTLSNLGNRADCKKRDRPLIGTNL
ncbi:MAG: leucine-rich repeat domain-containing protein, partial [Cyanobacteria bacterium P01_E01_bin.42]